MNEDAPPIGQRLRTLRRWRGLTLAELGGLAGVTPAAVSMWENGKRPLDRRSTISALAMALRVSETDLTGGPHLGSADRLQAAPHAAIPALRVALETNSLSDPASDRARPLSELASELQRAGALWQSCDYAAIGSVLPDLIDELHVHAAASGASQPAALSALVEACLRAAFTAKNLGYPDLAHVAAMRATEAAAILDDPVTTAKAAYVRLHAMPREGTWDRVMLAAQRAADRLEPQVSSAADIPVLGQLVLTAAMAAAVAGKAEAAAHWLDQADRLAARVPDSPDRAWQSFSATNVGVWRVAVAVERGEGGGKVLQIASGVNQAKLRPTSRLAPFLTDIGRGLARDPRTRQQAVRWLRQAEDAAPQRFRNNPAARETVIYLRDRATATVGRELRGMAARMGVPH